ncbi:hypothetical protein [Streptomyces violascens]|uniref:hypothetical protein n=1 Tax=Streptomyces violascens TaxID=67381 RepID=UPI001672E058|nr:hypothetical protein [Streptomyces violascens]GGU51196.1 hypothetical protein GCM10010289_84530 [Streptomyces violascens]
MGTPESPFEMHINNDPSPDGGAYIGIMSRGKTRTIDVARAQLAAAGTPYEEIETEGRIELRLAKDGGQL